MIYKDAMESAMVPQRADEDWIAFASSFNGALDRLEQMVDDVGILDPPTGAGCILDRP